MKKAIKYLMLALLIVPCALTFVACGNKTMNFQKANQYRYDMYKQQAVLDQETSTGSVTTGKKVVKKTEMREVTYNETENAAEPTTKKLEHQTETTYEIKIERSGKDDSDVLKITVSKVEKRTAPTVKVDTQTLTGKNTVTTTTEKATYYYGKAIVDEVESYVILSETSTGVEINVDGVNQTEGASEPTLVKRKEIIATVGEDGAKDMFLSQVSSAYNELDIDWIYDLVIENEEHYEEFSRTQSGDKVNLELKKYDVFDFSSSALVSDTKTVEYNNYTLSKFENVHTKEGVDSKEVTTTTIEYQNGTVTVTLPTDLTAYGTQGVSTSLLYTVSSALNIVEDL